MRSFFLLFAVLLATVAFAIDPPKPANPPPAAPPATEQKAEAPVPAAERPDISEAEQEAAAKAAAAEEEEVLPPLPADATPSGPPPARFNPTEKVRADFPVSFPIDI
jgi:cytoskeletal protein RodZ